jgi:signal peptidase I
VSVREIVFILLIAVLIAVFIQSFFIKAFIIPSSSMEPTLQIGDRVMVDRVTYYFRKPRRGDIVVFRYPPTAPQAKNTTNLLYWPFEQIGETLHLTHRTNSSPFVKRVIATGGETIMMKRGQVYIDGKPIKEDYKRPDTYDLPPTKVPKGHLFCMGDNRPNSRDSRYWGTVPIRSVIGKVFLIWWPPSRFGLPGK